MTMGMSMNSRFSQPLVLLIGLAFTSLIFSSHVEAQEISSAKQARIDRLKKMVDDAGSLFKDKDFDGSAEKVRSAQKELLRLASGNNPAIVKALKKDYDRIDKARTLLESQGQTFESIPDFNSLATAAMEAAKKGSSSKGSDSKGSDANEGSDAKGSDSKGSDAKGSGTKDGSDSKGTEDISFVNQVAPILIENCGMCHIDRKLGRYSMTNYNSIKKGTQKGVAVKPRDLEKSRMVALISSGKMPPRKSGKTVPEEDLQVLKDWIAQGAKFDGKNNQKSADLGTYVNTGSDGSGAKKGSDTKISSGGRANGSGSKGSGSKGSGSK